MFYDPRKISSGDILLSIHVLGAIGYSTDTLISLFGLLALYRGQCVEQIRAILGMMDLPGTFSIISLVLLVATGFYMTVTTWGWQTGWINVALGSLVALIMPTGAVMGTRRRGIARSIKEVSDGPATADLEQKIRGPLFGMSTILLNGLWAGIIILMVAKPAFVTSIIVIGVSAGVGLVFSSPTWRGIRRKGKTTDSAGL